MRIAMINDCSFVGETLAKYLRSFEVRFYKRSRGLLGKTLGVLWAVNRAKADVYHVHYLLQDCYLALRLDKHPIVGHAHGSDLRTALRRRIYGRIVRHNLENCDKILVSTPDILAMAKKYNETAEYIPNPVDTEIFYPSEPPPGDKLRVLVAAKCDWKAKGTDKVLEALARLKNRDDIEILMIRYGPDVERTMIRARKLGLRLNWLEPVPHMEVRRYYWAANLVIGPIGAGSLGVVDLEAIACGRPTITHVSSEYPQYRDFPLRDIDTPDKIAEAIELIGRNPQKIWRAEYDYFNKYHDPKRVAGRVARVYEEVTR